MNFLEEYDEMDGYEKDDIPILDVDTYYNAEDFELDALVKGDKPEWVIIDNVIYKRKTAEEILKAKLKRDVKKDSGGSVRRKA